MRHSDLSLWSLWLIHIVTQYNLAYRSVCNYHNVNQILGQFVLFIHVSGHC